MNHFTYAEIGNTLDKKWETYRKMITSIDDTPVDEIHIRDICISIIMSKDNHSRGGSFVEAVLNNDLSRAISYADTDCRRALALFVYVKEYVTGARLTI
jgi:hypothetical protein